jgi:hypothetical protein
VGGRTSIYRAIAIAAEKKKITTPTRAMSIEKLSMSLMAVFLALFMVVSLSLPIYSISDGVQSRHVL